MTTCTYTYMCMINTATKTVMISFNFSNDIILPTLPLTLTHFHSPFLAPILSLTLITLSLSPSPYHPLSLSVPPTHFLSLTHP